MVWLTFTECVIRVCQKTLKFMLTFFLQYDIVYFVKQRRAIKRYKRKENIEFSVGQVWQTSRGCLWHVKDVLPSGEAMLRLGGYGRKQFKSVQPCKWILQSNNSRDLRQPSTERCG